MANKLSEYLVQEILSNGSYGETCYKVKHKQTNNILIWKAYDCKIYTTEQLNNISSDVKCIKSSDNEYIIKYYETIMYSPTSTLYIVTELFPKNKIVDLIDKCETEHLMFDETFIWRCLYQMAFAAKHLSQVHISVLEKHISTKSIYVTDDFNIKIDPFYLNISLDDIVRCDSDMCQIGEVLHKILSLNQTATYAKMSRFRYSEDLQSMFNVLLHNNEKSHSACLLKPDIILHHPTVLINFCDVKQIFTTQIQNNTSTLSNDSAFESDESIHKLDITVTLRKSLSTDDIQHLTPKKSQFTQRNTPDILEYKSIPTNSQKETYIGNDLSPTLAALDLKIPGYVPRKESEHVKKWKSRLELCKEPQEVSEQALNEVWLKRMANLREREEALKQKEFEIDKEKNKSDIMFVDSSREANDTSDLMSGITMQPSVVQKVFHNERYVSHQRNYDYLDSKKNNRQSISDGSVASDRSQRSGSRSRHRRSSSVKTRHRKKKIMNYEDLNSSLSADPGDSSMIQTSNKLSSDKVPRPKSIHNIQRRKVHFNNKSNPFAEYDTISSTVLTFFDIENLNASYEVPRSPPVGESLADRIAKFSYLDLERMTNEKRAVLEEIRKTPPKVNRTLKPTLKARVKAADNVKKFQQNLDEAANRIYHNDFDVQKNIIINDRPSSSMSKVSGCSSRSANSRKSFCSISSLNRDDHKGNTPPFSTVCKDERRKPIVVDIDFENELEAFSEDNKENQATPAPKLKKDSKRKSILGFKTPFKFRLQKT